MDPDDPPRKHYAMKAREFERVNAPRPDTPLAPPAAAGSRAKATDPNDVYALLQQNRAIEQQTGHDEIELRPPRKSKRKRDFWVILVGGNLFIIGSVLLTNINVVTVMFGLGGMVILSVSLSWVMWFVMSDY